MHVVIQKIGDAEGIILPSAVLERLKWRVGDKLRLIETGSGFRLALWDEELDG